MSYWDEAHTHTHSGIVNHGYELANTPPHPAALFWVDIRSPTIKSAAEVQVTSHDIFDSFLTVCMFLSTCDAVLSLPTCLICGYLIFLFCITNLSTCLHGMRNLMSTNFVGQKLFLCPWGQLVFLKDLAKAANAVHKDIVWQKQWSSNP